MVLTVVSDSHHQSTLDAVYVSFEPWSEFPIVPSYPHYLHQPRLNLVGVLSTFGIISMRGLQLRTPRHIASTLRTRPTTVNARTPELRAQNSGIRYQYLDLKMRFGMDNSSQRMQIPATPHTYPGCKAAGCRVQCAGSRRPERVCRHAGRLQCRGTSPIRNNPSVRPYSSPVPRDLW